MGYFDIVKESFETANRTWQLILMKLAASFINTFLLVFMVIIPIVITIFLTAGTINVSSPDDVEGLFQNPQALRDMLCSNIWVIGIVVFSLLLYLTVALCIWLYVYGGSLGVLSRATTSPEYRFQIGDFFSEGKRLFMPLMYYTAVLGLILIGATLIFGLLAVAATVVSGMLSSFSSALSIFIVILLLIITVIFSVAFMFAFGALTLYGSASVIFEDPGSYQAFANALDFFKRHPGSFWGYCLVVICIAMSGLVLWVIGVIINLIPILGIILMIPYQLFVSAVQSYLGLVLSSTVLADYHEKTSAVRRLQEEAAVRPY